MKPADHTPNYQDDPNICKTCEDARELGPMVPTSTVALNGVLLKRSQDKKTIWIPLPCGLWREIEGGCACKYCSADGRSTSPAYWDTLCIGAEAPKGFGADYAHTVHYPELHGAKAKRPTEGKPQPDAQGLRRAELRTR